MLKALKDPLSLKRNTRNQVESVSLTNLDIIVFHMLEDIKKVEPGAFYDFDIVKHYNEYISSCHGKLTGMLSVLYQIRVNMEEGESIINSLNNFSSQSVKIKDFFTDDEDNVLEAPPLIQGVMDEITKIFTMAVKNKSSMDYNTNRNCNTILGKWETFSRFIKGILSIQQKILSNILLK